MEIPGVVTQSLCEAPSRVAVLLSTGFLLSTSANLTCSESLHTCTSCSVWNGLKDEERQSNPVERSTEVCMLS
jgi:hypothetical protein